MKKNILLIIPNLSFGGAQVSFQKLSDQLCLLHTVTNVVFNTDDIADYFSSDKLISLDVPASDNLVAKMYYFIKRVRKIRKLKREKSIDVCISFLEGADYVNILSKQNEKTILSIRGSKYHDENIKGLVGWVRLKFLVPLLYKRADAIVTVNEGIKNEMRRIISLNKITTIYNSYNVANIKAKAGESLKSALDDIDTTHLIVGVGRLSPEKGFHHLIKVFGEVKKTNDLAKLVIIGSGKMETSLIDICQQTNLAYDAHLLGREATNNPDVIFLGYCPNPFPILKRAKIFTLCSSAEGFPNVILEAMVLGVPVISTDCPYGPSEILNEKNEHRKKGQLLKAEFGLLAPEFTEQNSHRVWADCIMEVLENKKVYNSYSKSSLKRALEFSSNTPITQWQSVISN